MEKINKIYGPPGTGKTFRLIRRVKAYERIGVPLHKIGYLHLLEKLQKKHVKELIEKEVHTFKQYTHSVIIYLD